MLFRRAWKIFTYFVVEFLQLFSCFSKLFFKLVYLNPGKMRNWSCYFLFLMVLYDVGSFFLCS